MVHFETWPAICAFISFSVWTILIVKIFREGLQPYLNVKNLIVSLIAGVLFILCEPHILWFLKFFILYPFHVASPFCDLALTTISVAFSEEAAKVIFVIILWAALRVLNPKQSGKYLIVFAALFIANAFNAKEFYGYACDFGIIESPFLTFFRFIFPAHFNMQIIFAYVVFARMAHENIIPVFIKAYVAVVFIHFINNMGALSTRDINIYMVTNDFYMPLYYSCHIVNACIFILFIIIPFVYFVRILYSQNTIRTKADNSWWGKAIGLVMKIANPITDKTWKSILALVLPLLILVSVARVCYLNQEYKPMSLSNIEYLKVHYSKGSYKIGNTQITASGDMSIPEGLLLTDTQGKKYVLTNDSIGIPFVKAIKAGVYKQIHSISSARTSLQKKDDNLYYSLSSFRYYVTYNDIVVGVAENMFEKRDKISEITYKSFP